MGGNGWDMERWGLGLVGTSELKKKILHRWLAAVVVVVGGCGVGRNNNVPNTKNTPLMGVFFVFEGGWGPGTRQTREARPMDVLFMFEAGVGPRMLEGWGGPCW